MTMSLKFYDKGPIQKGGNFSVIGLGTQAGRREAIGGQPNIGQRSACDDD